ncbi:MAG: alpha/beta fold hydrolase [Peptococcaceae bacterium]
MYQWSKVGFNNSRGLKLAGLCCVTAGKRGPMVVVCHGLAGSKEGRGRAVEMAEELAGHDWSTFLFDFTGVGESEGIFNELTLTRQIDDLANAVSWCRRQGFNPIIVQGRSFGGTTSLALAAHDYRVAGVCIWATPAVLERLVVGHPKPLQDVTEKTLMENKVVLLKNDFLKDIKKYSITHCASLISPRPLLVIHGVQDEVVPGFEAEAIYRAAGEPKELVWVEGGDHQFTTTYRQVWEIFFSWLHKIG